MKEANSDKFSKRCFEFNKMSLCQNLNPIVLKSLLFLQFGLTRAQLQLLIQGCKFFRGGGS